MKVVIDLQCLQTDSRYRGIGRYAISLARALILDARGHEVMIALRDGPSAQIEDIKALFADILPVEKIKIVSLFGQIRHSSADAAWKRQASEAIWAFSLSRLAPDYVFCPSVVEGFDDSIVTTTRRMVRYRTCAVVHDLIPARDPEPYIGSSGATEWYAEKISHLLGSDILVTNSEYTRREFVECTDFPEERIHHISSGVDFVGTRPAEGGDAVLDRLKIGDGFFLFVGSIEPRKNAGLMIEAFARLPQRYRAGLKLVFAGKVKQEDRDRLVRIAKGEGLDAKRQLVFTGFLSDEDLRALYENCAAFVFPSFAEGFGLPVLEAMAAGAPTFCSDRTSLPEVIGRTELTFDPTDIETLSSMMLRVIEDKDWKAEIAGYGRARAAEFSWGRSAGRLWDILEEHAAARPEPSVSEDLTPQFDYARTVDALAVVFDRHGVPRRDRQNAVDLLMRNADALSEETGGNASRALRWRIEGPIDSSYSLALVNRETARSLNALGIDVTAFSTEGPGDFEANPAFLGRNPDLAKMVRAGHAEAEPADVVSRLLFPPRTTRMPGRIKLFHHYAWEESGFPPDWIDAFNRDLDGLSCLSSHVRKVMIDNGLTLPTAVTGNGVDHWDAVTPDNSLRVTGKGFRFLHISTCLPRKGADVLLAAFGQAFRRSDDVSLTIKTTPNEHNTIKAQHAAAVAADPEFPQVEIIDTDYSDAQIRALMLQCHALVVPSRAEGLGLPAAEAMLSGIPVIATGWSGLLEICNDETAWLIDYDFTPAATHFGLPGSVWAEPKVEHLAQTMRTVRDATPEERRRKTDVAQRHVRAVCTWSASAWRLQSYIANLACWMRRPVRQPRIGWMTSWNARCGIATYSNYMIADREELTIYAATEDETVDIDNDNVKRNWKRGGSLRDLLLDILDDGIEVLVVQFNYGFFDFAEVEAFLKALDEHGILTVVELHATHEVDPEPSKRLKAIADLLAGCARVIVHTITDMNRLKAMGIVDNVVLLPHPYLKPARSSHAVAPPIPAGRQVIASYGYFLPNKGLAELVEAFALMVRRGLDVHLLLVNAEYPVGVSKEAIESCRLRIRALDLESRVTLITDYLADEQSFANLSAADLVVLPYQRNTTDSASGAVRMCLASGRPVAVTPVPIFEDVAGVTLALPGSDPGSLAEGLVSWLQRIKSGDPVVEATLARARELVDSMSFERLSDRMFRMLDALHVNRGFDEMSAIVPPGRGFSFRHRDQEFLVDDPRVQTTVGKLKDGALVSTGAPGVLTFGPYISLPRGRYRLSLSGRLVSGSVACRVTAEGGTKILKTLEIRPDPTAPAHGTTIATIDFDVDRPLGGIEFVVECNAASKIELTAFRVQGIRRSSGPAETLDQGGVAASAGAPSRRAS